MLDLHCHLLPGIDDGATDLDMALEMARIAVADGIGTIACTPHIYPGLYDNTAAGIRVAIAALQAELDRSAIELKLVEGADVHLSPNLLDSLRAGHVPTIAGSRYVLLEPPHHVAPPRFEELVFQLLIAGYVPIITHPERLIWIEDHYEIFVQLVKAGAWMQLTAGSLVGRFGKRPRYWADKMLDERLVHVLATDAHHPRRRPPLLAEGRAAAALRVGEEEARHMVLTRPRGVMDNLPPGALPSLPGQVQTTAKAPGFWRRLVRQA